MKGKTATKTAGTQPKIIEIILKVIMFMATCGAIQRLLTCERTDQACEMIFVIQLCLS